ncbi:neurotactin isoform X1 [Bombyx mori]|uniref:Carboxylesterase type B domain-containing protein n=1 Tax=Bombyx mori TaxID=7091 RepID=A0A8R1WI06_BOMMO|nr:neurotactin isoform X1 [Bombyx mori]
MSTTEINKIEFEDEKTLDKKEIEAEEKEVMLKAEKEAIDDFAELRAEAEGPVKAALSGDVTEQGREVKPKYIPIGAIKMPGFFTKSSEKSKDEEEIQKETDICKTDETSKPKGHHLKFLHSCPLTKFMHHPKNENDEHKEQQKTKRSIFNIRYPNFFKKRSPSTAEATLASMETLDDKMDTSNDGLENVKLEPMDPEDGKVATKLPLKERIRQKKFIIDDIVVCIVALLVAMSVIIGSLIGACVGPPVERPLRLGRYITASTGCGPVEGILDEGVYKFYSIPYAVPPIKEKRFTYAQPLNNLSLCWNETYQCHVPGPLCVQFLENGTITGEEDCLTLDIMTPHVRYDSPLPVVVLIGANTLAGGISPAQPSALYARTEEVIFVRPNFRLGSFGFLSLNILSKSKYPHTSGNYALSDLLAALRWIHLNINHFGGDPEMVTLLGHRAGATLTAALTTVSGAHKLYTRVWLSSPSVIFPGEVLEQSQKNNEQFRQMSKCNDADCLRRVSKEELLALTPDTWFGNNFETLPRTDEIQRSWLVLDGEMLRIHAYESWLDQKTAKQSGKVKVFKPMVFTTTLHSGHSVTLKNKHVKWTPEIVEKIVNDSVIGEKNLTAAVFTHFNKTYEGLVELISSVRTLCPLVSLARLRLSVPLYVVRGARRGAEGSPGLADVNADVKAILGTFDSEMPEQRRFMAVIQHLFYHYVGHGKLSGPEPGLVAIGQDLLPQPSLPACDLLIREDIVPRYAHVD